MENTLAKDRAIEEDIKDALFWSEYYAANENALEGGAVWVKNELEVE